MKPSQLRLASVVMIGLVGVVLILAGVLKSVGVGADDMLEGLEKARLIQHRNLISSTSVVCGILLLVPRTTPFGILMATAYWGGAIVAHLTYNDSFAMPAGFLATLWVGVWLRKLSLQETNGHPDTSQNQP